MRKILSLINMNTFLQFIEFCNVHLIQQDQYTDQQTVKLLYVNQLGKKERKQNFKWLNSETNPHIQSEAAIITSWTIQEGIPKRVLQISNNILRSPQSRMQADHHRPNCKRNQHIHKNAHQRQSSSQSKNDDQNQIVQVKTKNPKWVVAREVKEEPGSKDEEQDNH